MSHAGAVALLCFCSVCWSIAGVGTRLLESAQGFEITFWRSFFCLIGVVGALGWRERGNPLRPVIAMGLPGLLSGVMWAVMFICFMLALTKTSVANTMLVSSITPLLAAVLGTALLGERIGRSTAIAIGAALTGIWWMVRDGVSSDGITGMLIALGVPTAAAVNLVLLRKLRASVDLAPAVLIGAGISCVLTLPLALPMESTAKDLTILAVLGLVQLALPCMLMVRAARHLSAHEIALISMLEVVLGPLWAWLGAGEAIATATLQGGAMVLGALVLNEALGSVGRRASAR